MPNPNPQEIPESILRAVKRLNMFERALHDVPLPDGSARTPEIIAATAPLLMQAEALDVLDDTLREALKDIDNSISDHADKISSD